MFTLNEFDLQEFILTLQQHVYVLENTGDKEKAYEISNYTSFLSGLKYTCGIKTDPYMGIKFYISPGGQLLGGQYTSDIRHYNYWSLYDESNETVQSSLSFFVKERKKALTKSTVLASVGIGVVSIIGGVIAGVANIPAVTGILIENKSSYTVKYCDSNSYEGYFFTGNGSAANSFEDDNSLIPGYTLGFIHSKTQMSGLGASGYLTLRISTTTRTLIFTIGWEVNKGKKNRAGLKLYEFENRVDENSLVVKREELLEREHPGHDEYHVIEKQAFNEINLSYSFKNDTVMPVGYKLVISNCEREKIPKRKTSKRKNSLFACFS